MRMVSTVLTAAALAALAVGVMADGPAKGQESDADAKKEKQIQKLVIAAQDICPVSGHKLGSMGEAIKAKSGERTVYLCCEGCMGQPIKPAAWKQIQQNLIAAQEICPISGKPLGKKPAGSTVVKGRTVFVCCNGCAAKVEADPEKALAIVNTQLKKNVKLEKKTK